MKGRGKGRGGTDCSLFRRRGKEGGKLASFITGKKMTIRKNCFLISYREEEKGRRNSSQ